MFLKMNPKSLFHVHHVTRGHWPHKQQLLEQASNPSNIRSLNRLLCQCLTVSSLIGLISLGSLTQAQANPATAKAEVKSQAQAKVKEELKTKKEPAKVKPQAKAKEQAKLQIQTHCKKFIIKANPTAPYLFRRWTCPLPNGQVLTGQTQQSKTELKGWQLQFNGYARLPLMIADGIGGSRRPYLVDDQYFLSGFAYTRVSEREWTELFISASKGSTRMVVGLFSSELSDWAQAGAA